MWLFYSGSKQWSKELSNVTKKTNKKILKAELKYFLLSDLNTDIWNCIADSNNHVKILQNPTVDG